MEKNIIRRNFAVELRMDDGPDGADVMPKITGHAAVFNQLSDDLGGFFEKISPGAFTSSLDNDVRALYNHNFDYVLGRTKSGTLKIWEDSQGLAVEIDPPDTGWARDLVTVMRRGDVNQMSFAFYIKDAQWDKADGKKIRTILDVDLVDVSVVAYPAYPQTDASARGITVNVYGNGIDQDTIQASIKEAIGETETPTGTGGADDARDGISGRLAIRRRRLDLAEKIHRQGEREIEIEGVVGQAE